MTPEEATRLCVDALKLKQDWVSEKETYAEIRREDRTVTDALLALLHGDLRIVSAARLAALEKVAEAARSHLCVMRQHDDPPCEIHTALAELDALGGGDVK